MHARSRREDKLKKQAPENDETEADDGQPRPWSLGLCVVFSNISSQRTVFFYLLELSEIVKTKKERLGWSVGCTLSECSEFKIKSCYCLPQRAYCNRYRRSVRVLNLPVIDLASDGLLGHDL